MPPQDRDAVFLALEQLVAATGRPFDPATAHRAYQAAVRDIPPTRSRAARLRLAWVAESQGVQILARHLSVREALRAVRPDAPLAAFAVSPAGAARWVVLTDASGSAGRLLTADADGSGEWLDAPDLAGALGATDPDAVLEWLTAQPVSPAAEASANPPPEARPAGPALASPHADDDHHPHMPPFVRLARLLAPDAGDLWVVLLFAVGVGVLTLTTPVVAMAVVNTVALGTLVQQLVVLCVALFVALGLAGLLQYLQSVIVEFIQRRVFVRVAADLAYRLPRVALRAFDRQHGPELVNRFFDVLTVQKAAATLLVDGVTIALQMLIGLGLLGFYHMYLLGFDLALIAALAVMVLVLGRGGTRTAVAESIAKYEVAGWMEEMARHPVAFKMAGGPTLAMDKTDRLTRDYLTARTEHFRVLVRQGVFALFLYAAANVALLAIGGMLVIRGELTLGELVAAEIVVTLVASTFTKLTKQFAAYFDLLAAVDKLGHLIDLPLERTGGDMFRPRTGGAGVDVRDVTFTYQGARGPAVTHLSLRLAPGERVALVGPNGAGKSTLVDLLFGLRLPDAGWVEFDGTDIRSIRLESLRESVAVVKGLELVEGTVAENVRMGREFVSPADVRDALRKVGLLDAVLRLPDGLDTRVWATGAPLSLGQANRLMLARGIAGQPRLLILDEALDHMDADVRSTVLPAVLGPDAHWTLLVVSHSDEVTRLCDRVVRVDRPPEPHAEHH